MLLLVLISFFTLIHCSRRHQESVAKIIEKQIVNSDIHKLNTFDKNSIDFNVYFPIIFIVTLLSVVFYMQIKKTQRDAQYQTLKSKLLKSTPLTQTPPNPCDENKIKPPIKQEKEENEQNKILNDKTDEKGCKTSDEEEYNKKTEEVIAVDSRDSKKELIVYSNKDVVLKSDKKTRRVNSMNIPDEIKSKQMQLLFDVAQHAETTEDKLSVVNSMLLFEKIEMKKQNMNNTLECSQKSIKIKEEQIADTQDKKSDSEIEYIAKYSFIAFMSAYIIFSVRYFSSSVVYEYLTSGIVFQVVREHFNQYVGYFAFTLFGNVFPFISLMIVMLLISYLQIGLYTVLMIFSVMFVALSSADTFWSVGIYILKGLAVNIMLIVLQTIFYYKSKDIQAVNDVFKTHYLKVYTLCCSVVCFVAGWYLTVVWICKQ